MNNETFHRSDVVKVADGPVDIPRMFLYDIGNGEQYLLNQHPLYVDALRRGFV